MNCNLIKDKLLDYIDGELNNEEERKIKEHLENCLECSNEYMELKSAINHLIYKLEKVDSSKEMDLDLKINKIKPIRKITRTGLIAVALSLILVVSVFGTEMIGFMEWWKKSSEDKMLAWEQLIENGVGEKLDISVIDKDIKLTAEGIIADEINTVIILKIEDLKNSIRFTPASFKTKMTDSIRIDGDISRIREDIPPMLDYINLYSEEENAIRIMLKSEPMTKDEGNIEIYVSKLQSMINKDIESIVEVNGNWKLEIPAKKIKSQSYEINEVIDVDGNDLIIEKITLAPTATNIVYKFKEHNKDKGYIVNNISFVIKHNSKTYGYSKLSSVQNPFKDTSGYCIGNMPLESLYLENPEEIQLVVETFRYTTVSNGKYYDIKINKLPQAIKYNGSNITIKNVIFNEDSTELIIKEDTRKNRKYVKSIIEIKAKDNYYTRQFTTYTEFETRDNKGIVRDLENKGWNNKMYNLILEQKITLENDNFKRQLMNSKNTNYELIPNKIYIKGQEFIKHPNIKKNIKLK